MPILAKHLGLSSLGRFIADKAYPKAFVKEKHVLAARMQQVKSIRTTALHNAYQTFEDIMQEADPDKRARYMKLMTKAEGESEEEAKTKANILFYELLCESAARYKKEHGAIAAGRKTLEWITRLAVFPTLSVIPCKPSKDWHAHFITMNIARSKNHWRCCHESLCLRWLLMLQEVRRILFMIRCFMVYKNHPILKSTSRKF